MERVGWVSKINRGGGGTPEEEEEEATGDPLSCLTSVCGWGWKGGEKAS